MESKILFPIKSYNKANDCLIDLIGHDFSEVTMNDPDVPRNFKFVKVWQNEEGSACIYIDQTHYLYYTVNV